MISRHLRRRDGGFPLAKRSLGRAFGLGVDAEQEELEPCQPLHVAITCCGGSRRRLLEDLSSARHLAGQMQGLSEWDEQVRPARSVLDEVDRASEQIHHCPDVPSSTGGMTRVGEPSRGALGELGIGSAELRTVSVRTLQVVPHDLVGRVGAEPRHEPVGIALVEHCPLPLRDRLVRRVADQDVAEAEAVVARQGRPVGADQLLTHQRE